MMTLPEAEECLKKQLGHQYIVHDWKSALDAVMNGEGDILQAQEALHKFASECQLPHFTIKLPCKSLPESATIPQIIKAEQELMESVKELVKHRWIIGSPPTLEDLVDPVEEWEIGDLPYRFEGGDAEIVAVVQHEMAVARGDVRILRMMLRMMLKTYQLKEKLSSFVRCLKKCALAMGMQISHLDCPISYTSTEQSCSGMPFLIPHRPH